MIAGNITRKAFIISNINVVRKQNTGRGVNFTKRKLFSMNNKHNLYYSLKGLENFLEFHVKGGNLNKILFRYTNRSV